MYPARAGNNRAIEADCSNLLALCYVRLADYENAVRYARNCYDLDRKTGDPDKTSSSLNTLAGIYMSARQPEEARKYIEEGLRLSAKANNMYRRAVLEGMASEIYIALGDSQTALEHAREGYAIEQRLGRKDKMAVRMVQMAVAYFGVGQQAKAFDMLNRAIPQLKTDNNDHSLALALLTLGRIQSKDGNLGNAISSLRQAGSIFARQGDLYNESHACLALYEVLRDTLPEEAMDCQERYRVLQDSIYDREVARSMGRYSLPADATTETSPAGYFWMVLLAIVLVALACAFIFAYMRHMNRRQMHLNDNLLGVLSELRAENQQLRNQQQTLFASQPADASETDRQFLSDAEALINDMLNSNTHATAQKLARQLGMSQYQLRRRIAEITGTNINSFIQKTRMQRARRLLLTRKELSVMEVSLLCDYSDQSNFTRTFKRVFGMTPSQFTDLQKNSNRQ